MLSAKSQGLEIWGGSLSRQIGPKFSPFLFTMLHSYGNGQLFLVVLYFLVLALKQAKDPIRY
jgi:hypothetical protein